MPTQLLSLFGGCLSRQILPAANTLQAKRAVENLLEAWHLEHYDMHADIATRDNDTSVQHLSFLYGVGDRGPAALPATVTQTCAPCCTAGAPL